jgi:pimeloyl-ACP methyl ester carboxylesterase/class 3 adenylate cyclase
VTTFEIVRSCWARREDELVFEELEVRYARSGDARIAYSVRGAGPHEIVYVPAWFSNQDLEADETVFSPLLSFSRFVSYDERGSGLSDPVTVSALPTLEGWADDLHAVLEAANVDRAVLLSEGIGGPVAALYAATHPERTRALILLNSYAALAWAPDFPWGVQPDPFEHFVEFAEHVWGTGHLLRTAMPDVAVDEAMLHKFARRERQSMAPAMVGAIFRNQYAIDVRAILTVIKVPTLILHSVGDQLIPVQHGRYLAEHIPNAQLVELPSADNSIWAGSVALPIAFDEIEEFVTGVPPTSERHRMLTTLLFTDVVASTEHAATVGDRVWRSFLDRHDDTIHRQLDRFSGIGQKHTGDGILATFDGPARGIRCGCAIRDAARQLGLEVRVGVHTGEVEQRGKEIAGIAVHLAHRVCEHANSGEVLVSRTVVDLVAGSGITFNDRGEHELKGIAAPWHLYAVAT